jgi:amino acid transporter
VINVLVASLGFYWPAITAGAARTALLTTIITVLAIINVLGIRQSAWVVNALTIGKLLPLALFIVVGMTGLGKGGFEIHGLPPIADLSNSALLLIFAFGGYEVIPVPAGESKDPQRTVPFALIMTIVVVTIVLTLAQVVALGTLPSLPTSKTPLADASALFMGATGAAIITLGAVLSTLGNNMGQALSGSRSLYALAENGDVPSVFARVSARFGTPVVAILFTAIVSLVLATSGSFTSMARASAVSRLVVYVATCAATLRLRNARFAGVVAEPTMRTPLGPVVPVAAILIALAILVGATAEQLQAGVIALVAGAVLFGLAMMGKRT